MSRSWEKAGAGDENSRRKTEAAGSCFQQRVLLRPERLSRSRGGRGGVALRAAARGRGAARGSAPSKRYPRGSKAVPDLRGAELLLHRLLVGKPLGRLEAGERGHRAAVSEEPGRGGAGGRALEAAPVRPAGESADGAAPSLDPPPRRLPPSTAFPEPSSRAPALSAAGTSSLGPGGRGLGFPPEGKTGARGGGRPAPGARGPPPAAEVTVREIERRHEFLYPLQSSAPVLQGRRRRHRHRRALAALPGRPLPLPARPTAGNQRFRRPKGAFRPRAAFRGTLAALGRPAARNSERAAEPRARLPRLSTRSSEPAGHWANPSVERQL